MCSLARSVSDLPPLPSACFMSTACIPRIGGAAFQAARSAASVAESMVVLTPSLLTLTATFPPFPFMIASIIWVNFWYSTSACAWVTLASKVSGSIRAITSPRRTFELKSARSCLIWPEIWLPTWTVITALRAPVADTVEVRGPRSTRASR